MNIRLEPYKHASAGAKRLAGALGVLRTHARRARRYGDDDVIINWGNSQRRFDHARYINDPEAVALASCKLAAFQAMEEAGVQIPAWTTEQARALEWWENGLDVVARLVLRGHSGRGIVLCGEARGVELQGAPLYTLYAKKAHEYRVHVMDGVVIDAQQKRKRKEVDNERVDYQIRHANSGWVYCRGGVDLPAGLRDLAVSAVDSLGLEFGAVDIGYNVRQAAGVVYEVNTAPGLEGSTISSYVQGFRQLLPQLETGRYIKRAQRAG